MSLLILNGSIVNEGRIKPMDLYIKNGRIERIDPDLSHMSVQNTIDATGMKILPGLIDDQVHFREPGMTQKANIYTESRAAVAGGITTFMEMPNTNPQSTTIEKLENKFSIASKNSLANYSFYLGATVDNLDQIKKLNPKTACGIKIFMGSSTGNMLVDAPDVLEQIYRNAPSIIATHCEDTPTILVNEFKYKERYGENIPFTRHPMIRSEEACYKSSSMAVELAKKTGAQLHILHITTKKELELFTSSSLEGKQITAEACVHHLYLNDNHYKDKGALIKCNPSVKTEMDQQALISAVLDNQIDIIATDHAPHLWEEKQNTYFYAPSGLPLIQHSLLMLLEFYHKQIFDLALIAQKTSHAVADRFKIIDRGYIREGYWADLVIVDCKKPTTINKNDILYKCGWSPFEGETFRSSIDTTIVSGEICYKNGKICSDQVGKRIGINR